MLGPLGLLCCYSLILMIVVLGATFGGVAVGNAVYKAMAGEKLSYGLLLCMYLIAGSTTTLFVLCFKCLYRCLYRRLVGTVLTIEEAIKQQHEGAKMISTVFFGRGTCIVLIQFCFLVGHI